MSVLVRIKGGKDEFDRMFFVAGEFSEVKAAMRAAGAKFDARRREWVGDFDPQILDEIGEVTPADFYVGRNSWVIGRAEDEIIWSPPRLVDGFPADARDFADEARRIARELQEAFAISPDALRQKMEELGI